MTNRRSDPWEIRCALLRGAHLPDQGAAPAFARLTHLARKLLGAPVAQVNILTPEGQVSLGSTGPGSWSEARPRPFEDAWCRHVVETGVPLVTGDARRHPLLDGTTLVREDGIVAYASHPVTVHGGTTVGTVCVMDFRARSWSESGLEDLAYLAASAATEIELRWATARARTETLLESFTDGLYVLDREWCFTYVNGAAAARIGRPAEALLGRRIWDLGPGGEGGPQHQAMARALGTGLPQAAQTPSIFDPEHWLEVRIYPTPEGLAVFTVDATARRCTDQSLRRRERQLAEAQRLLHVGSFEVDVAQGIITWSDEAYRIFGREPGSRFTTNDFLAHLHPGTADRVARLATRALQHGAGFDEELRIVRADGEERRVHARAMARWDRDATGLRLVGTLQDVTERYTGQAARSSRRNPERTETPLLLVASDAIPDPGGLTRRARDPGDAQRRAADRPGGDREARVS